VKVSKVALSVRIRVAQDDLDSHAAASAAVVGNELAQQVARYVREQRLGYYPALEYFNELKTGVDADLLEAVDSLSWLANRLVREEVRKKLRPLFASLRFNAIQNMAWSMPTVRPGQNNALTLLAEHYTPNDVKLELTASLMQRDDQQRDFQRLASHLVHRWLGDSFEQVEVTSCRRLD
jgi:hypothetical protein